MSIEAGSSWQDVDRELRRLARGEAALDYEVGTWLLAARDTQVHRHLGYASLAEYALRVLGYDSRKLSERLRVAQALLKLPEMAAELREGLRPWSAIRELTRVAVPRTEREWLAVTARQTVRQIEELVANRRLGDRPEDPRDPTLQTYLLRLEVSAECKALYRQVITAIRSQAGQPLGEEEAFAEALRQVLGTPSSSGDDAGRSPYQVALTVCETCQRTWQEAGGEAIEVAAEVAERAACDAQNISHTHVGMVGESLPRASQSIPPAVRRLVFRRDRGRCAVPGCRNHRWLEIHHVIARSEGGNHDPESMLLLCGAHHRQHHQGRLSVTGSQAKGFCFRHADGTPYGEAPTPTSVQASSEVFGALRQLGFPESTARRAIEAAHTHVGMAANRETLLHAALRACPIPAFASS